MRKVLINALFIICLALQPAVSYVASAGQVSDFSVNRIRTYKDIPGVTEDEITEIGRAHV